MGNLKKALVPPRPTPLLTPSTVQGPDLQTLAETLV